MYLMGLKGSLLSREVDGKCVCAVRADGEEQVEEWKVLGLVHVGGNQISSGLQTRQGGVHPLVG
jgi:hypothetical protein